ncbi:hypothetical protein GWK41_00935 [Persephonella atlantica]|uniref:Fimbrial assembly protein n=1 Tax=Persephonella atlantica TaxID=2699429 RepID=A0ABS1GFN1_9AQUI|nr:hypothetical protein [Persephonella atlantica]MBK3331626.1 hypothetical protein [Persephonella atlantica]
MKIYSVESGRKIRKGITVRKKGDFAEFVSFDKKSNRVYLSVFYPDLIFSTVVLPPVEDSETLMFLLKNRLTGLLEEGKNYSFTLFEKERISEGEISYDVYAIPEDIFFSALKQNNLSINEIDLFTVDAFSLIPFSQKEKPGKTVFHFYGDEEKILMVVSRDTRPVYTRVISVPEFVEKDRLSDIYYENFNMTYMFVYQNRRIDIEDIIVSGKAAFLEDFISLVKNLTGKSIHIPKMKNYISGMSEEDFHDYIIPIGTAFLEDRFSFIPLSIKKKKVFSSAVNLLIFIFIPVLLTLTAINLNLFIELKKEESKVYNLSLLIDRESKSIQQLLTEKEIKYYSQIFKNIRESRKSNPLTYFYDLRDIFLLLREKSVQFDSKNREMTVISEESFNSIADMILFKNRLEGIIKEKRGFNIKMNVQEDQQNLKLVITVKAQREKGDR